VSAQPTEITDDVDIAALSAAKPELHEAAETARQALATTRYAENRIKRDRAEWCEATLTLAAALLKGRELCQNNDRAFGAWLKYNNLASIKTHDREALLNMARHLEAATAALAETGKVSWQTLWQLEIKPKVQLQSTISPRPSEDDDPEGANNDPAVVDDERGLETQTKAAQSGAKVTRETVRAFKNAKRSSLSATRSAKPPQRTGLALSSISVEKFRDQARPVVKRLMACLEENSDDDLIEHVKNCLAQITALVERCQGNGGAR
jgi:hypothetical protein